MESPGLYDVQQQQQGKAGSVILSPRRPTRRRNDYKRHSDRGCCYSDRNSCWKLFVVVAFVTTFVSNSSANFDRIYLVAELERKHHDDLNGPIKKYNQVEAMKNRMPVVASSFANSTNQHVDIITGTVTAASAAQDMGGRPPPPPMIEGHGLGENTAVKKEESKNKEGSMETKLSSSVPPSNKREPSSVLSSFQPQMTTTLTPSFPYIKGTNITLWDHHHSNSPNGNFSDSSWATTDTTKTKNCFVGSNWNFKGFGQSHYAFTTPMVCHNVVVVDNDDVRIYCSNEQQQQSRPTNQQTTTVVLRLKAENIDRDNHKRRYKSITDPSIKAAYQFSKQLQGKNWSNHKLSQYFAVSIGYVDIPMDFFDSKNDTKSSWEKPRIVTSPRKFDKRNKNVTYKYIRADLSFYAPGSELGRYLIQLRQKQQQYQQKQVPRNATDSTTSKTTLRMLLQHLVTIYRHMYQQRVVNCDLNHMKHFLVEEKRNEDEIFDNGNKYNNNNNNNDTTNHIQLRMIDFEKGTSLDSNKFKYRLLQIEQFQLWQLLGFIGKVCGVVTVSNKNHDDNNSKINGDYKINTFICHRSNINMTEWNIYRRQLIPVLEECPFQSFAKGLVESEFRRLDNATSSSSFANATHLSQNNSITTLLQDLLTTTDIPWAYAILSKLVGL